MSAPGAGGGYDGGQDAGGQVQGGPEYESAPAWLGPINERMEELTEQSRQMQDAIGGLYYEDEPGEYEDGYELDDAELAQFGIADDEDEDYAEENPVDTFYTAARDHFGELDRQQEIAQATEEGEDALDELREQYPILQDERFAAELVNRAAQHHAKDDPHLLDRVGLVRQVERELLAYAYDLAVEQQQQPEREVMLESASGSVPQQASSDGDYWGDRVVSAAQKLRPTI